MTIGLEKYSQKSSFSGVMYGFGVGCSRITGRNADDNVGVSMVDEKMVK